MRRLVVLVLLAGCWLPAATWLQAGSALAQSATAGPGGGAWGWPVDGPRAVTRPFAPPAARYGTGHRGADLVSAPGAVVRAAGAGRVSYAGLLAGRGVVVVVHGALRTTYEPVTTAVPVGADVVRGQPLGRLAAGHAGCPAPACLHWGLRRGEDYLDPVRLVERGPVRLLPLEAVSAVGAGVVLRAGPGLRADTAPVDAAVRAVPAPAPTTARAPAEPALSMLGARAPLGATAVALLLAVGLLTRARVVTTPPGEVDDGGRDAAAGAVRRLDRG